MEYTSWDSLFSVLKTKDFFQNLMSFLDEEYKNKTIYPPRELVFNAFKLTPLDKVKVVIFGQDPYPNPNEAMGLAFSVNRGIKVPPSLINIYKEIIIEFNLKCSVPRSGDLTYLANQGVLLLNTYLTCVAHQPLSHANDLYKKFFADVLYVLNRLHRPIIFLLWGSNAKKYHKYLINPMHLVIETNHPSPLSANRGGWFNSGCFKNTNDFLIKNNLTPIDWFPPSTQE